MIQNLRTIRVQRKKTQSDIAKLTGFNQTYVSKWENGEREPDIATLIKLANYFNVSLDELVGNQTASKESANEEDLSPAKKEVIEKLLACNDRMCDRVSAYIDVLNDRELAEDVSKFKHNDNF